MLSAQHVNLESNIEEIIPFIFIELKTTYINNSVAFIV